MDLKKKARKVAHKDSWGVKVLHLSDVEKYIDKATLAQKKRDAEIVKEWDRWSPESDEELDNIAKAIKEDTV